MLECVTLNEDFVEKELRGVALSHLALLQHVGGGTIIPKKIDDQIKNYQDLFDKHHGIPKGDPELGEHNTDRQFLAYTLDIMGKVLNLEDLIPIFEKVIETDWKAHTELNKEKRYRDHITHPFRVTAIGWWLLHRNDESLLEELAKHYDQKTAEYRRDFKVETGPHNCKALVEYIWLACGLLHDAAYPLEYHLRAKESLLSGYGDMLRIFKPTKKRFTTTKGREVLLSPLNSSWFSAQDLGLNDRMEKLGKVEEFKHAHALLGPLHYMLSLGSKLPSLQGLVVQLAARAIVTHHDDDNSFIETDPLARLLFVADNLQAWERPYLHREQTGCLEPGVHKIRTIVECNEIRLVPDGNKYSAQFCMNCEDKEVLANEPYSWQFDKFRKPNHRVERLLNGQPNYPSIVLSEPGCIHPEKFRKYMKLN